MTYKTHITGGLMLTLGGAAILNMIDVKPNNLGEVGLLFGCAFIGSLLPDIDHPNSKINKYNPLSTIICMVAQHRSITHSLLWMVVVSLVGLLYKFNVWAIIGLNIGILSHLILDMMNPTGVPLFYPYRKMYRVCKISTGSAGEWCVLGAMGLIFGLVVLGM